jgi:hypothetical protein
MTNKNIKRFQYESHKEPLLPGRLFIKRILNHVSLGLTIIFISLLIGIIGYHFFEGMSWIDSLLNASMILGGMGPVGQINTISGKVFASFYALFSGIVFLVTAGIIFAPVVHRFLHKLHIEIRS